MMVRPLVFSLAISVLTFTGMLTNDVQAQTDSTGGWKGMGYLTSISPRNLEPGRCSYRLTRFEKVDTADGGASTTLGFLDLSGHAAEVIPNFGKLTSVSFDVPLKKLQLFANTAKGIRNRVAEIQFFLGAVAALRGVSCEVTWTAQNRFQASDTVTPGVLDPELDCSGQIDLHFADGTTRSEARNAAIRLDPRLLALQIDSSCQ